MCLVSLIVAKNLNNIWLFIMIYLVSKIANLSNPKPMSTLLVEFKKGLGHLEGYFGAHGSRLNWVIWGSYINSNIAECLITCLPDLPKPCSGMLLVHLDDHVDIFKLM